MSENHSSELQHKHAGSRVFVLVLLTLVSTELMMAPTAHATQPPTQFAITIIPESRPSTSNALLQNLPTLFALDHLFRGASNGLLNPYQTTLGNILILYRLFFGPL
jgi:hypothetical protein